MSLLRNALLTISMVTSISAAAEPAWKVDNGPQMVFTAATYAEDYARLVVECRAPTFLSPEVVVTLVPPDSGKLSAGEDTIATFRAGEETAQLPMTRIDETGVDGGYRWTGVGVKALGAVRKLADAASSGAIAVTLPGKVSMTFKSDVGTSSAMQDVVLRCMPSIVRARRQAREMSNVQTVLTLEQDANDRCRGGGVEDVLAACAERTEYIERLHVLGMCYGKQGEFGYQQQWHRCGPNSIR